MPEPAAQFIGLQFADEFQGYLAYTFPAEENPGLVGLILAGLFLERVNFLVSHFADDCKVVIRDENDNKGLMLRLIKKAGLAPKAFEVLPTKAI